MKRATSAHAWERNYQGLVRVHGAKVVIEPVGNLPRYKVAWKVRVAAVKQYLALVCCRTVMCVLGAACGW